MKKYILMLAMMIASTANASVIYDENIDGDASGTIGITNLGTIGVGSSSIFGSTPGGNDDDWFNFSILAGTTLDSIVLTSFTGNGGNLGWSQDGISITSNFQGPFNSSQVGLDLLENGPLSAFGPFLLAGTYAIKFGTGTNVNSYGIDFNVSGVPSTVPVPAAAWLFGSALIGFFGFSRRKKANA